MNTGPLMTIVQDYIEAPGNCDDQLSQGPIRVATPFSAPRDVVEVIDPLDLEVHLSVRLDGGEIAPLVLDDGKFDYTTVGERNDRPFLRRSEEVAGREARFGLRPELGRKVVHDCLLQH